MPISVQFACNDYRNGVNLGYAEAFQIEGIEMVDGRVSVRGRLPLPKKFTPAAGDSALRVGRLIVPCFGYSTWVGNWCWDGTRVRAIHALKILNYLIAAKWHCEQATCELYDAINKGNPISVEDWKRLLPFQIGEVA